MKGKQRDNVNKAKPHLLSAVGVEIPGPRKPREGGSTKSVGGGDSE